MGDFPRYFFVYFVSWTLAPSLSFANTRGSLLSDVGRCVASMTLYDVDKDRYVNETEFFGLYQDLGGCNQTLESQVFDTLVYACIDYDFDFQCYKKGVALIGKYSPAYTNAVCNTLQTAVLEDDCQNSPQPIEIDNTNTERGQGVSKPLGGSIAFLGIASVLSLCVTLLLLRLNKQEPASQVSDRRDDLRSDVE